MKKLTKADLYWKNHIEQFLKSGLAQVDYCKKHGLNAKSFSVRKSEYFRRERKTSKDAFVPIIKKGSSFTIKLSTGLELSFDETPDPTWIGSVLKSIGQEHDQY